jgi:hypothetical protein
VRASGPIAMDHPVTNWPCLPPPPKLEPKISGTRKKSGTGFWTSSTSPPKKHKHHTGQPLKMAKMLPYGSLPHDRCWPLNGQKSCYKKCDQTKMGARTPRPIPTNAVAERNGLIACKRPHQTGHVFVPSHHHHNGY